MSVCTVVCTNDLHCCAGERNLYALSEAGQLLFMRKFNFSPLCFLPYAGMSLGEILVDLC